MFTHLGSGCSWGKGAIRVIVSALVVRVHLMSGAIRVRVHVGLGSVHLG